MFYTKRLQQGASQEELWSNIFCRYISNSSPIKEDIKPNKHKHISQGMGMVLPSLRRRTAKAPRLVDLRPTWPPQKKPLALHLA